MLYPLKFKPVLKPLIWGGQRLRDFGKNIPNNENIGESWELSGLEGNVSVVSNGTLAGNTLNELLEVYLDELVGEKVFEQYGKTFPLLFKLIDANSDLSIQVHPNDEIAMEKHNSFGKTEMWYIVDAEPDAKIVLGFNRKMDAASLRKSIEDNTLEQNLKYISVKKGDVFYIPAGAIHAIGKGILIAEIQQSSGITYRLYDYGRLDERGNPRDLHVEDALQAIDYNLNVDDCIIKPNATGAVTNLVTSDYFTTNLLNINSLLQRDYSDTDSFVVYMCLEGKANIIYKEGELSIQKGDTVLLPNKEDAVSIHPEGMVKMLEVWK